MVRSGPASTLGKGSTVTFTVSLFNPTGGATFLLFGNTNCVVQIGDNDPVLRGLVTGVSVTATNASATGNGYADSLTLSDDGRYVAFASSSTDLLAADVDEPPQVFVRDLTLGTTTRASVNRFGTNGADNGASQPRLARNGRYLAFVSTATDLSTNDTSTGYPQVYLRDSVGGTTLPVSLSNTGRPENEGVAANPLITSNGLGVAFQSTGLGLLGIVDANLANDVYFREVAAGMTHVVSVNRWGTATGNGESYLPEGFWFVGYRVHGRHIGFTSFASDLVAGDSNGTADVFVRDLTNGVTTLASVNRFGTGSGNGQSIAPLVSADGRYVLFLSSASDLVADDTNESTDVFVRDLVAGVTSC